MKENPRHEASLSQNANWGEKEQHIWVPATANCVSFRSPEAVRSLACTSEVRFDESCNNMCPQTYRVYISQSMFKITGYCVYRQGFPAAIKDIAGYIGQLNDLAVFSKH